MLDALKKLLGDKSAGAAADSQNHEHDVRFAACVLLVELAMVDGEFSDVERARVQDIIERHFGVDAAGATALIAEAVKAATKSVDDFVFTRQLVRDYTLAQRMVFAELMWQVVLADGTIDSNESYLMRKLANLLQLEPAYLSEARKKTVGEAG